ncbi:MAG: hypothetical protein ACF8QF_12435, partial [Phycisphaerales bacterium]
MLTNTRVVFGAGAISLALAAPALGAGPSVTRLDHNYSANASISSDFIVDPIDGLERIEATAAVSGAGALARSGVERFFA